MKRVILTGATGFIGSFASTALRDRDFEIHAVGRHDSGVPGVFFHRADLLDPRESAAVIQEIGASHLLHLAWYVEPGQYRNSEMNLRWVAASLELVRLFTQSGGQRVVLAGTCAEYEWRTEILSESSTPCAPATLYGAAKDGLHRIVRAYAASVGLSYGWGRIFYLYGPGEKGGRLVSDAIQSLLAGRPFRTTDGRQRRDFLHVSDVARAFVTLLDSNVLGAVNIGSGEAIPVRTILARIAELIGRPDLIEYGAQPLQPTEPECIQADRRRLERDVGFRPTYTLERGLAEMVARSRQ